MNVFEGMSELFALIGLPSMLGGFFFLGRKLQTLDSLHETTKGIKHNLAVVTNFLTRHHAEFDPSELQTLSPLQLTEGGKEFIESVGFDKVFAEHKEKFFQFINQEAPKFKYDVELAAIKSIIAFSQEPFMDFLKIYFYNNPNRSLDNVSPTLGIYIRDFYLLEHPEITQ